MLGAVLVFYYILMLVKRKHPLPPPLEYRAFFLWFLWATLASLLASNIDLSWDRLLTIVQVVVVSFCIYSLIVWQTTAFSFWTSFTLAVMISSAVTLHDPGAYVGTDGRIAGTVGNANLFSVVLNVALAVTLVNSAKSRTLILRAIFLGIAAFLFYMIAETGSRKGMIGSILVLMIVSALLAANIRRKSAAQFVGAVLISLLLLIGAGTFLATSQHANRLEGLVVAAETGDPSKGDNSLGVRAALAKSAFNEAVRHPILGIGLANFRDLQIGLLEKTGTYSHSNYLEILVSTGIPGLLLYTSIYFILLYKLYTLRECVYHDHLVGPFAICSALILMIMAFDFAMVSYYDKSQWLLLSGVIAQIELLRRKLYVIPA